MKHPISLIILPLIALAIVSCEPKAESTPMLQGSTTIFRTNAAGVCDTLQYTDTLCIGDTARMSILLEGYLNTLTSFTAKADTSALAVAVEVLPEQMQLLTTGTDLEKGQLKFVPGQVMVFAAKLRYIPRSAGTHRIDMMVASDASEQYSPRYFYLDVKAK